MVKEPLHRADAIKTLADVCCEEVFNDVQKRCFELTNDTNTQVRKAALIGILKLSRNLPVVFADHHENSQGEELKQCLSSVLKGNESCEIISIALLVAN